MKRIIIISLNVETRYFGWDITVLVIVYHQSFLLLVINLLKLSTFHILVKISSKLVLFSGSRRTGRGLNPEVGSPEEPGPEEPGPEEDNPKAPDLEVGSLEGPGPEEDNLKEPSPEEDIPKVPDPGAGRRSPEEASAAAEVASAAAEVASAADIAEEDNRASAAGASIAGASTADTEASTAVASSTAVA